jgi:hypothetical protein
MPKSKKARDEGPNPFLAGENGEPGWLELSYNSGVAYEVSVPGKFVEKERHNRQGEVIGMQTGLEGDAEKVVFFLRQAANLLDIGVRIVTEPTPKKRGIGRPRVARVSVPSPHRCRRSMNRWKRPPSSMEDDETWTMRRSARCWQGC